MNDKSSSSRTRIEVFPNELFLEVFQYVDPIDLHSFKGLNQRIDSIVQAMKINLIVQYQNDDDLDRLSEFSSIQIIRLELLDYWSTLNLNTMIELRCLILDCTYLTIEQLNQMTEMHLPHLERLSVSNIPYDLRAILLYKIIRGEHFPSLKICQLKFRHIYNLELNDFELQPENVICSLVIDTWNWAELDTLWRKLPHLHRFETSFNESWNHMNDPIEIHTHPMITHLNLLLHDPLDDLEKLLQSTPNLMRLRIRGNFGRNLPMNHFEKMAGFLRILVPRLQKFDCELYCYADECQGNDILIQKLHLVFSQIRCLHGTGRNQCYATDMMIYPANNEYEIIEQPIYYSEPYGRYYEDDNRYSSHRSHFYDEYDDSNDGDNGFTDYGLGYRGNYKRNYGCSPWSGNND